MNYSLAIDLGTTTIVGAKVDLNTNEIMEKVTIFNPQAFTGGDVLTRVKSISDDDSLLHKLSKSTVDAINEIIEKLGAKDAKEIALAGNTIMEHIFLNISPKTLAKVPYRPAFKESKKIKAKEIGIDVNKDCPLFVFPIIGGFVGGDTVSAILGTDTFDSEDNILIVDIGTNSEIVLHTRDKTWSAATPAGPAFEGGEITHGMKATKGAIEGISLNDHKIKLKIISSMQATGICGSGLIDITAFMLDNGLMEPSGRIKDSDEVDSFLSEKLRKVKNTDNDENSEDNELVLYKGAHAEVTLTQADIRALQFAKSALRSGMDVLLEKASLGESDIDKVIITGTFGINLKVENLIKIGLLSEHWKKIIFPVENACLLGAKYALTNINGKDKADEIAEKTSYLSLSGSKRFEKAFFKNLNF